MLENIGREINKLDSISKFVIMTFLMLVVLSFIPEFMLPKTGIMIKKINMFSDIVSKDSIDNEFVAETVVVADSSENITENNITDTIVAKDQIVLKSSSDTSTVSNTDRHKTSSKTHIDSDGVVRFEDYTNGINGISTLVSKINRIDSENRPFRIGFLGDSFIEGDIVTANICRRLMAVEVLVLCLLPT